MDDGLGAEGAADVAGQRRRERLRVPADQADDGGVHGLGPLEVGDVLAQHLGRHLFGGGHQGRRRLQVGGHAGEDRLRVVLLAEHLPHHLPQGAAAGQEGQAPLDQVGRLRGGVDGQLPAGGVDLGHDAPRLHGLIGVPVLVEGLDDDAVGVGEGGVDVAPRLAGPVMDVGLRLRPHDGPVGVEGLLDGGDRRERPVLDLDQLAGVLRHPAGVGHHDGHRIADVTDPVDGQRPERGVVDAGQGQGPEERIGAARQVGAGQDQMHAGEGPGGVEVDGADLGVGGGAAEEGGVEHAGDRDVVDVAAGAGQEPLVLDAPDPGSDEAPGDGFTHGGPPPVRRRGGRRPGRRWAPRRRRRCSGSRCSGTGCPTAPPGSLPGWDGRSRPAGSGRS